LAKRVGIFPGGMKKSGAPRAPKSLGTLQRWFSKAVSRPLLPENKTRPEGVEDGSLASEALRIRSANGVDGLERLSLYNRQYWFRYLNLMQPEYPCAVHAMGLDAFNAWVVRYLDAHPSDSPYLAELDRGFPAFVVKEYRADNRDIALEAVR
jgi:hypothetical protein